MVKQSKKLRKIVDKFHPFWIAIMRQTPLEVSVFSDYCKLLNPGYFFKTFPQFTEG
jgi:hypothetical protein